MIFDCPHCSQSLEVDDVGAGQTVNCPTCHRPLTIPKPSDASGLASDVENDADAPGPPSGKAPPMHVPLQPMVVTPSQFRKRRKGSGCAKFFLFVIVLIIGGFGYGMYRWHERPDQTWSRLTTFVQRLLREQSAPAPTPIPEPTPAPTPRPDPIAWLVEHKEQWPKEVILREAMEFPAVSAGKIVGSLTVPAGVALSVHEITKQDLVADFMGGTRRVPIAATDLPARAAGELAKAELTAKLPKKPLVTSSPAIPEKVVEQPETIREATSEETKTGLGALYTRPGTTFRLFAPNAKAVSVVLYDEALGNQGRNVHPLRQQLNGIWDLTVSGDLLGKFYTFLLDGADKKRAREVLDPYAINSVASSTRGRVSALTNPLSHGPALESPTDAIIYEMHVRDFTIAPNSGIKNGGLYLGWTESGTCLPEDPHIQTGLDHLVELGVTHVELMPTQDFDNDETSGSYNWGYVTTAFFSPEGMFASNPNDESRMRELKRLVATLHSRGLSVIMDVVYNHTSGNCSLMSIAPEYYYRRAPSGALANGSGCGNEFASESPMARRLIIDSLKYWVKEYGIDGFRFDLMALIDQDTIREIDRELRALDPHIVLFGEPWTGGTSPLREKTDKGALRQVPPGAFNDDFRNALKGSPDGNDPGWIQNGSNRYALKTAMLVSNWLASPAQSINYLTCHDNLVLWDKLVHSMPNADEALRIETMKLGYLALFTSQGVPFIHGGEEFARTKGGNSNSFEAPDSVNQVDWDLKRQHLDLFHYVRDLIALRKTHPMFRLRTRAEIAARVHFVDVSDRHMLTFTVDGQGVPGEPWKRAWVMLNSSDDIDSEMVVPGSAWSIALDEHGAVESSQPANGKVTVRHKSGVVLFQP